MEEVRSQANVDLFVWVSEKTKANQKSKTEKEKEKTMRKSHKFLAITLLILSLGTPAIFADEAAEAVGGVININTADAAQFALLPRLGLKAGERIVAYREEHGPFKKVTDLMQVKGIGDKTFQLISPYLVLEGKSTLTEAVRTPRKPRAKKASNTAQ